MRKKTKVTTFINKVSIGIPLIIGVILLGIAMFSAKHFSEEERRIAKMKEIKREISENSKQMKYKGKSIPWTRDVKSQKEFSEIRMNFLIKIESGEIRAPKGSDYIIGLAKDKKKHAGVYYYDPTSSITAKK